MSDTRWADWIGRTETLDDVVSSNPPRALAATLGRGDGDPIGPGYELPPLWTWLFFLPIVGKEQVGPDGHPKRGGFLPPIDLPRRMWAGSKCSFHGTAKLGEAIRKTSTITKVEEKTGNAGTLVFVTVTHEVSATGRHVMTEQQDIVYMNIPATWKPPAPTPLPECAWSEGFAVDPVFLFRFSALTFNGHRIHYDRTYAMEVEKYPGLVVHGPAQAILLMEAAMRRNAGKIVARFSFRGLRPLFDFDAVSLNGRPREDGGLDLFIANADGAIGMQASLTWAS